MLFALSLGMLYSRNALRLEQVKVDQTYDYWKCTIRFATNSSLFYNFGIDTNTDATIID